MGKKYRWFANIALAVGGVTATLAMSPSNRLDLYESKLVVPKVFACKTENIYSFIYNMRDKIRAIAEENGVSSLLIAATLVNENECRPRYEDWKDEIGLFLGMNPSIGIAQVRISTAIELYKKYMHKNIGKEVAVRLLKNDEWNIRFIAMYYRREMERVGMKRGDIKSPEAFVNLVAKYVGGGKFLSNDAQIQGYNALLATSDGKLWNALGISADPIEIKKIRDFVKKKRNTLAKKLGRIAL